MDAAERNYKDPNHKPGWFALTPFTAMNAFREFSDIVSLYRNLSPARIPLSPTLQAPNAEHV